MNCDHSCPTCSTPDIKTIDHGNLDWAVTCSNCNYVRLYNVEIFLSEFVDSNGEDRVPSKEEIQDYLVLNGTTNHIYENEGVIAQQTFSANQEKLRHANRSSQPTKGETK